MTDEHDGDRQVSEQIYALSIPTQLTLMAALEQELAGQPLRRHVASHAVGELLGRLLATEVREHPEHLEPALLLLESVKTFVRAAAAPAPAQRCH